MPSPGKYVIKTKYPVADSPSSSMTKRSATLSTSGRSFTIGDGKVHFQKPNLNFIVSKPSNESKPATVKTKLTKAVSKKTNSLHASMFDENFIRYMKEFDSYFKVSESRNQSSDKDLEGKTETSTAARNRVRYATEVNTSIEVNSSGSLSDARSFSFESPKSQKKWSLPRVSLVYDTAPHIDLLDSPKSFSETASSYYATPDQDRSFITTPSENYSFFATASEQSSYLTAELNSLDESHTFIQDQKQYSSQETLYNDDDIFKDDDDDNEDELRDQIADLAGLPTTSSSSNNVTRALSRLSLGFRRYDHLDDKATCGTTASVSSSRDWGVQAKVRRSNFIRTTCIDLEEEEDEGGGGEGSKNDLDQPTINLSTSTTSGEGKEKEGDPEDPLSKCSPV